MRRRRRGNLTKPAEGVGRDVSETPPALKVWIGRLADDPVADLEADQADEFAARGLHPRDVPSVDGFVVRAEG